MARWFGRKKQRDDDGNEADAQRAVEELLDPYHHRASINEGDQLTVEPNKVRERIAEVMARIDNDINTPAGPEDAVSFDEMAAVLSLPGGPAMLISHVLNTAAAIMLPRYPTDLVRRELPAEFDLRVLHPQLEFEDHQHELARVLFNRRMAAAVDLDIGDLDADLDPLAPADHAQVFIATFFMFGTKVGALQYGTDPQRVDEQGQVEQDEAEPPARWSGPSYDPTTGSFRIGETLDEDDEDDENDEDDEDGGHDWRESRWQLHDPGVGLRHGLIVGPERSGKTNSLRVLIAEALGSGRFVLALADPLGRNGLCETFADLAAGGTARSYGETLELLTAAAAAVDARRNDTDTSPDPTPDDPGLLVVIDDADAVLGNKRAAGLARHITTYGATAHVALVVSTRTVNRRDFGGDTTLITDLARNNCLAFDTATAQHLHGLVHPDSKGDDPEGDGEHGHHR